MFRHIVCVVHKLKIQVAIFVPSGTVRAPLSNNGSVREQRDRGGAGQSSRIFRRLGRNFWSNSNWAQFIVFESAFTMSGPNDIEAILWANKVESRRCYLNQGRWQVLDVIGVEIMVIRNVFLVFDVSKLRRRFVALTSSKLNGEQRLTLFRTCMRQYSDTQVLSRAVCMIQRTKSWSSGSHELSRRKAA